MNSLRLCAQRVAALSQNPCGIAWDFQTRGFAWWGFPPRKSTGLHGGMHCHPGRERGYPNPIKRQPGKVRRLPNVKLKSFDYSVSVAGDGTHHLRPPFPPRVNRTIDVEPQEAHKTKNPWPTKAHKDYKLKWRNIEYVFVPELTRKPHGTPSRRFAGPVTRIEYVQNGKPKTSLVTHDVRLLDW